MRNIMIDTETFGTKPGCVILSIGAVEFDQEGLHGTFHAHIDVDSSTAAGLTMDARTVMWWLDQEKAAQNAMLSAETVSLIDALDALEDTFDWDNKLVWANGASFDFPIIEAACHAVGRRTPWMYYNQMCYRTLKNVIGRDTFDQIKVDIGIAHDALDDASAQALTAIAIMQHLGIWKAPLKVVAGGE